MHFKKILSIFLAAVLTLSMLTVFAVGTEETEIFQVEVEAETTASTLSASPLLYRPGEEIKVTLRASQNTGVTSVMLYVDYDETVLKVSEAGCKATGLLTEADELTHGVRSDGDAYFTFYSDNYPNVSTATGTIAEITFIAKEVCTVDSVLSVSLFQNNEELCTVQTESGAEIVPFVGVSESFSVHDISADSGIVTEPACTEGGYTTYVCQGCGEDVVGNFTEATGHTPGEAVEENRVEPTCTEKGSYDSVVYCEVCGEEVSREPFEIEATGHTPGEAVEENRVEPTCTEKGSYDSVVYCEVCDAEIDRVKVDIEATGHTPGEAVEENRVEPTCTEKGSYDSVVYCEVCDAEIDRVKVDIEATCHTPGEAVEENRVEPTCTEKGSYDSVVYCEVCDAEIDRVKVDIEATCHTPGEAVEENRVEPTCTEKGSYDSVVYCEVCGEEVSREPFEIDALGHVLVQVAAKAPTCTESGWNAYESCQREGCGYSTYQELPASGHKFGETTVYEPEYNKEGYSVHTCTVCGYEERFNIVPPLPYLAGDVNGDGRLTGADYLILKRAILKIAPLPDKFAAAGDFNGDGEMTATDYLLLKRQILFGE